MPYPRLGVLDFCRVRPGRSPREALLETTDLAERVEALGYSRYWLAEHYTPSAAHASPAVLSAVVAGVTSTIRVGAAGVLAAVRHADRRPRPPVQCREKLAEIARDFQTDEVIFLDVCDDPDDRVRCYELLAADT